MQIHRDFFFCFMLSVIIFICDALSVIHIQLLFYAIFLCTIKFSFTFLPYFITYLRVQLRNFLIHQIYFLIFFTNFFILLINFNFFFFITSNLNVCVLSECVVCVWKRY